MSADPFAPVEGRETLYAEFIEVRRKKQGETIDQASQLVEVRRIARGNYVVARNSLTCRFEMAGCILAHQSIEEYLKGIVVAYGGTAPKNHRLPELVGIGRQLGVSGLVTMSQNKDQMDLIKALCSVYDTLRFSEEAGYVIAFKNVILLLDEIAIGFEKMYSERLGEPTIPQMYVHETMRERFLKYNDYWTSESVTNNPLAARPSIGIDAPDIPVEDTMKGVPLLGLYATGTILGNIRLGSVVKKIPKEEQAQIDAQRGSRTPPASE